MSLVHLLSVVNPFNIRCPQCGKRSSLGTLGVIVLAVAAVIVVPIAYLRGYAAVAGTPHPLGWPWTVDLAVIGAVMVLFNVIILALDELRPR